jgi:hypothetical protein
MGMARGRFLTKLVARRLHESDGGAAQAAEALGIVGRAGGNEIAQQAVGLVDCAFIGREKRTGEGHCGLAGV